MLAAWCPVGFTPQAATLFGLSADWLNLSVQHFGAQLFSKLLSVSVVITK